jgi:hypothetical protein
MNDTPADRPETLADAVVEEFDEYRPAGEFRAIAPVIDTTGLDRRSSYTSMMKTPSESPLRSSSSSLIVVLGQNKSTTRPTMSASSRPSGETAAAASLSAP